MNIIRIEIARRVTCLALLAAAVVTTGGIASAQYDPGYTVTIMAKNEDRNSAMFISNFIVKNGNNQTVYTDSFPPLIAPGSAGTVDLRGKINGGGYTFSFTANIPGVGGSPAKGCMFHGTISSNSNSGFGTGTTYNSMCSGSSNYGMVTLKME